MPNAVDLPTVRRLSGVWASLVIAFLYLPLGVLIVQSFVGPNGWTLSWYRGIPAQKALVDAGRVSLIVATWTTGLSVVLGTASACLLTRRWVRVVLSPVYLPIILPDVILGVGFLGLFAVVFSWLRDHHGPDLHLGLTTLVLAHTTVAFPFVMVSVAARLVDVDPSLEEAAMDLGATPGRAFRSVVLPLLWPAVVAGAMMAFALSLDDYVISSFVKSAETQTLPVKLYGLSRVGLDGTGNVVATAFVVSTAIAILVGTLVNRKKESA